MTPSVQGKPLLAKAWRAILSTDAAAIDCTRPQNKCFTKNLRNKRGFVHPPVGGQFDEHPIVPLGIADPPVGHEDVALDELPPIVGTALIERFPGIHTLLDGEAAVLGRQIDAIPLTVHPQLFQSLIRVVPQERVRDDAIPGLTLDAIGEIVCDDNDLSSGSSCASRARLFRCWRGRETTLVHRSCSCNPLRTFRYTLGM